jgi:hypothetical protein
MVGAIEGLPVAHGGFDAGHRLLCGRGAIQNPGLLEAE